MRLLLPFALLAAPAALAQEAPASRTFEPPPGCTAYVTVQGSGCGVSHHFTCEGDPAGWQRRVDMDEGGVTYFGAIDRETQWVESNHVLSGHTEALAPDPADPASFDTLVATGVDSFDFITYSPQYGATRYKGQDRLTGETVTIDGVTLDRTEFRVTAFDASGAEIWSTSGHEYISRDWRMFISGTSTTSVPDGEAATDENHPVDFIFPGEEGFLGVTPRHGCGQLMSRYEAPLLSPISEARG
jgi:hypothetical protein